jgi:hypothetical protein
VPSNLVVLLSRRRDEEASRQTTISTPLMLDSANGFEQGPKFNTKRGTFSELNQADFEPTFASSDSKPKLNKLFKISS